VLFEDPALGSVLRYFEVAAGGHTTLERHEHVHAVMVVRGQGECMVGDEVFPIGMHDLVQVPPMTWHQFRAPDDETLGFLCLVNAERDRPQLPGEQDLAELRRDARRAAFIRA
jgi:mannose-6-phosphate isomerase-like protein (cupin superfamily)